MPPPTGRAAGPVRDRTSLGGKPNVNLRNRHVAGRSHCWSRLVVTAVAALVWGSAATSAAPARVEPQRGRRAPGGGDAQGELRSRLVGTTANGRERHGQVRPAEVQQAQRQGVRPRPGPGRRAQRGRLHPHVRCHAHGARASRSTVRRSGRAAAAAAARRRAPATSSTCVLGPLDLDLLGLQVDLNRVVLEHRGAVRRRQPARQPAVRRRRAARRWPQRPARPASPTCSTGSWVGSGWASDPVTRGVRACAARTPSRGPSPRRAPARVSRRPRRGPRTARPSRTCRARPRVYFGGRAPTPRGGWRAPRRRRRRRGPGWPRRA